MAAGVNMGDGERTRSFFDQFGESDKNAALLQMMLERAIENVEKESEKASQQNASDIKTLFSRLDDVKSRYTDVIERIGNHKTEIERRVGEAKSEVKDELHNFERETDKDLTRLKAYMTIIAVISSALTTALVQFIFHRAVGR
jgi:Mg2+ and Co2+ transporter CorA